MAAIRNLARMIGHDVTPLASLRLALLRRGYKRQTPTRSPRKPRVPITIWVLAKLAPLLAESELTQFSLLSVGVWGLFRGGELSYKGPGQPLLARSQVTWFPDRVVIRLLESKTDYERKGVDVVLHKMQDCSVCPYTALLATWNDAHLQAASAPVFQNADGSPITYNQMLRWTKEALQRIGIEADEVGLHSMRIGGATSLAMLGIPAHVIKVMGRWESLAYQIYTRVDDACIREAMRFMAVAASSTEAETPCFGGLTLNQATEISQDSLESIPRIGRPVIRFI